MVRRAALAAVVAVLLLGGGGAGASQTASDRLPLARDWVAAHPGDAETLRFLARQLNDLERHAEAADALARAARIRPDDPDPVLHVAVLVRLGRMDEARAVAEAAEARLAKARGAPPRAGALRLVAEAMVTAGELGRARMLLDTALAQTPADAGLLVERAAVEAAAGRPVRGLAYLEKAVDTAPADPAANRALVRALAAAGMPVRAVEVFEAARKAGLAADEPLLTAALVALQAYGDHQAAVALADAHLARFPKSAPVLRAVAASLAALGDQERAVQRLRQALALAPPDASVLALVAGLPAERREPLLKDLRRRFPAMPEPFAGGGQPPRGQAWAWLREADSLAPAAAIAHLARGVAELPDAARTGRAALLLRLAELEPDPGAALARLDRAEQLDPPRGEVLARRARILAAAGRWDEAAAVTWDWARTRPDDGDALAALFQPEVADRVGWARVFAHLHDHVQRDPQDPRRLLRALARHAGTGGSAVLALAHAQALERLEDGDHAEGRRLGAQVTRALEEVGRVADIDFARTRVALETADGRLEAVFHPITGRLARFSVGERWIAAEWSPDGLDLVALTDWTGHRLEARRRDGRLVAIEAKGSRPFRAEIAPDGSPAAITADGGDAAATVAAYNAALALLDSWPRTGLAGARWLKLGP